MPKKITKKFYCGFTLLELLIVIVIISVLVAVAIPKYNNFVNRAKAIPEMGELMRAIILFHETTGRWPYTRDENGGVIYGDKGNGNIESLESWKSPKCGLYQTAGQYPNWCGPYITDPDEQCVDPWGNTYWYDGNPDGEPGPRCTGLFSPGPNGVDDGSWSAGDAFGKYKGDDVVLPQR